MRSISAWLSATLVFFAVSFPASAADAPTPSLPALIDEAAQRRAMGDSSPIVIELNQGTYVLDETVELTAEIVGKGLTIRGKGNGKTILSGAIPLQPLEGDGKTWRYLVPDSIQVQQRPRVLLVDNQLARPARHPNFGYVRIAASLSDRRSGFEFHADDIPSDFSLADGECDLVFLHDWSSSRLPIESIDHDSHVLKTNGPIGCEANHYAIDHFEKHPRYLLEGHRSLADRPGEWYFDSQNRQIVLVAGKESEPPAVAWPLLEQLIVADANAESAIKNLRLENLVFSGTTFPMPPGGLAGAQASMHEPRDLQGKRTTTHRPMLSAAVQIHDAVECKITHCRFQGLGNTALWLGRRSTKCLIDSLVIEDVGGNGINLGEDNSRRVNGDSWYKSVPQQVPSENTISGNEIRRCGQLLPGSVAVWSALTKKTKIISNTISDCPYTGISIGWIWNTSHSPAELNEITSNQIHHVMQTLSDGGGIYTLGRQPDSLIANNQITDIPLNMGRAESNGMFLDQGSTGFTIAENEFRRIAKSPLRFHQAGENTVRGNKWEQETDPTPLVRYNATPEENITVDDDNVTIPKQQRIYLIGNSLTWDTRPPLLDGHVDWHVDCGKSLPFIRENPSSPCVGSSRHWPKSLKQLRYDIVSVQPHYGSDLKTDVETISEWMEMQPTATFIIHSGWPRSATAAEEYDSQSIEEMVHSPAYLNRLQDALREKYPDREIGQTRATEALHRISTDIASGKAPLSQLSELYRDAIHMTHGEGRYLMHNLMRSAVGQDLSSEGFPIAEENPELKRYLDSVIQSLQR